MKKAGRWPREMSVAMCAEIGLRASALDSELVFDAAASRPDGLDRRAVNERIWEAHRQWTKDHQLTSAVLDGTAAETRRRRELARRVEAERGGAVGHGSVAA